MCSHHSRSKPGASQLNLPSALADPYASATTLRSAGAVARGRRTLDDDLPAYQNWLGVLDLCAESPSNGPMEKRSCGLIDIDRDTLKKTMCAYFNPAPE